MSGDLLPQVVGPLCVSRRGKPCGAMLNAASCWWMLGWRNGCTSSRSNSGRTPYVTVLLFSLEPGTLRASIWWPRWNLSLVMSFLSFLSLEMNFKTLARDKEMSIWAWKPHLVWIYHDIPWYTCMRCEVSWWLWMDQHKVAIAGAFVTAWTFGRSECTAVEKCC